MSALIISLKWIFSAVTMKLNFSVCFHGKTISVCKERSRKQFVLFTNAS